MATKVDVPKPMVLKKLFALEVDLQREIDLGEHPDSVLAHLCNVKKAIKSIHDAQNSLAKLEPRPRPAIGAAQ